MGVMNEMRFNDKELELIDLVKANPSTADVLYDQSSCRASGYVRKTLSGLVKSGVLAKNGDVFEYVGALEVEVDKKMTKAKAKVKAAKQARIDKGVDPFNSVSIKTSAREAVEKLVEPKVAERPKIVKEPEIVPVDEPVTVVITGASSGIPAVESYPDVAEFHKMKDPALRKDFDAFIELLNKPKVPDIAVPDVLKLDDKLALLRNLGLKAPDIVREYLVSTAEDLVALKALRDSVKEAGL